MEEVRPAIVDDYAAILGLLAADFVDNLTPEERRGGYLTARFTLQQIDQMARDVGIIVAVEQGGLVGCLCNFSRDFDHGSPVVAEMVRRFDRVRYRGRLLGSYELFIYGPVIVARGRRGCGVLRRLYERLLIEVAGRYEVGVAFVAHDNPSSMGAHRTGLGMEPVDDFECNGSRYTTLVFEVPSPDCLCE
ncbi:MAG: GNAT family N-acetyltransferase [Thermoleophilia bacterium]